MKQIKNILFIFVAATLIVAMGSFRLPPKTMVPISVIVNKDNPIASLSAGEVKLYWLRKIKTRWPGINKNIRPVDRKGHCAEQETFYAKILSMNADEVETYFVTKQYQNAQKPQDKFNSDKEVIDFIGDEIGGIGFVNQSSMSAEAKSKVKVVFTVSN